MANSDILINADNNLSEINSYSYHLSKFSDYTTVFDSKGYFHFRTPSFGFYHITIPKQLQKFVGFHDVFSYSSVSGSNIYSNSEFTIQNVNYTNLENLNSKFHPSSSVSIAVSSSSISSSALLSQDSRSIHVFQSSLGGASFVGKINFVPRMTNFYDIMSKISTDIPLVGRLYQEPSVSLFSNPIQWLYSIFHPEEKSKFFNSTSQYFEKSSSLTLSSRSTSSTINIFVICSGHMYEKLCKILLVSGFLFLLLNILNKI
jgi:hypothetical protein